MLLNGYQPEQVGYMKVGDVGTNVVCTTNKQEATRYVVYIIYIILIASVIISRDKFCSSYGG